MNPPYNPYTLLGFFGVPLLSLPNEWVLKGLKQRFRRAILNSNLAGAEMCDHLLVLGVSQGLLYFGVWGQYLGSPYDSFYVHATINWLFDPDGLSSLW